MSIQRLHVSNNMLQILEHLTTLNVRSLVVHVQEVVLPYTNTPTHQFLFPKYSDENALTLRTHFVFICLWVEN